MASSPSEVGRWPSQLFLGDESFQTPVTRGVPERWPRYPSTTYSRPVPESSIEGFCVREKQVFDVCQTLDFKLLWLLFNHFSVKTKTNKQWVRMAASATFTCDAVHTHLQRQTPASQFSSPGTALDRKGTPTFKSPPKKTLGTCDFTRDLYQSSKLKELQREKKENISNLFCEASTDSETTPRGKVGAKSGLISLRASAKVPDASNAALKCIRKDLNE